MMFGYDMNWMMWLFASFMVAGVTVLVIVAVLAIAGRSGTPRSHLDGQAGRSVEGTRSRARQILDERFARGELSAEQYGEHLRVLGEE